MKTILSLIILLALFMSGCANEAKRMETNRSEQYIGTATMENDGTIVLRLRAELDQGANYGEGYFRYPPTDPEYQTILKHVGSLKPGESRHVLPWPDTEK